MAGAQINDIVQFIISTAGQFEFRRKSNKLYAIIGCVNQMSLVKFHNAREQSPVVVTRGAGNPTRLVHTPPLEHPCLNALYNF